MFDHHWSDRTAHGATMFAGVAVMAADAAALLSWVGAVVGLGGLLCSLSREVRAWLERREKRRGP